MLKAGHPVDRHVGARVRMRRLMLGLSMENLGEALGVSYQQVQKYERGHNRLGSSRLQHVAMILQVPVGFFFEGHKGDPNFEGQNGLDDFLATSDGQRLARAFMRIKSRAMRQSIIALIEQLGHDQGA
jgi:transcriptional regulator with XRE-family HTH domain